MGSDPNEKIRFDTGEKPLTADLDSMIIFGIFYLIMALGIAFFRKIGPFLALSYYTVLVSFSLPVFYASLYIYLSYDMGCIIGAISEYDYLYFSYVAFTTVGFGDLQPEGICRLVAASEAILGYISLGLFVGFASNYLSSRSQ